MMVDNAEDKLYSNILLLEERGVGVYRYKETIDEIFEYCKKEIERQYHKYFLHGTPAAEFDIPIKYISKFDFIDTNTFKICVVPKFEDTNFDCDGTFNVDKHSILIDDKLTNVNIVLNVSVNVKNGEFYFHTFYNTLYHELNHAYQMYNSMLNDNIYYSFDSQPSISEHIKDLSHEELRKEVFKNDENDSRAIYFELLFYYVFDKFEFNAKIAGVYGEVKTYYKNELRFQDVLAKTEMYGIYHAFMNSIKELVLGLSNEEFNAMMRLLKKHGVQKTWGTKYSFLRRIRYWLELLIKKIGRTASLCYDELEDAEHINERRTMDVVSSEDNVSKLGEAIAIIKSGKY